MEKVMSQIEKIVSGVVKDTKKEMISRLQNLKKEADTKEAKNVIQLCIDALKQENENNAE